jgi:hypothetical protein
LKNYDWTLIDASKKNDITQHLAAEAISYSILHGDITLANKLLESVKNQPKIAKQLIVYMESWGNLQHKPVQNAFGYLKKRDKSCWDAEIKTGLESNPWFKAFAPKAPRNESTVVDADKEIRRLVERLLNVKTDSKKVLLHEALLTKVQDLILDYGRSDEKAKDDVRANTLFDKSTTRTTTRASIYAKGS